MVNIKSDSWIQSSLIKIINGENRPISRFRTLDGAAIQFSELVSLPRLLLNRIRKVNYEKPWLNEFAIQHFDHLLVSVFNSRARVLEIGGGGSTFWLTKKSGYVMTIEESRDFEKLLQGVPDKLIIGDSFQESLTALKSENFDIVFIDGGTDLQRRDIIEFVFTNRPDLVIILDNSDREIFQELLNPSEKYEIKTFSGMLTKPFQMSSTTFWYPTNGQTSNQVV